MSSTVQSKRLGNTKQNSLDKTKSSCSSGSLSSSDNRSNSMEVSDGKNREPVLKQSRSKAGSAKLREKEQTKIEPSEDDVFAWIDPLPSKAPSYNSVNPNRRVVFPVYDVPDTGHLPPYSPSVEEITLVSMKMEWVDPYNISPSRGWKNFIMEINSTQVNFYHIDPSLTKTIRNYCNGRSNFAGESIDPILEYDSHHSIFNSLGSKSTYQFNKADQETLASKIKKDKTKYLSNSRLFRTYSLQFAKFGIPTDYNRKTFVLRLRCETDQFLLSFSHVDDMIMWAMHLSIGIGVALDLDFRELPSYRTVPRRRRRRRRKRQDGIISGVEGLRRITADKRKGSVASNGSGSSRNGFLEAHSPYKKPARTFSSSSHSSHGEESHLPSSPYTPGSRRGSNDSIKSKLKNFFNSEKKASSPSYKSAYFRTVSTTGLNSVVEDEEEDSAPPTASSVSNSPTKAAGPIRPQLDQRSQSMGTMNGNAEAGDYFGFISTSAPADNDGIVATPGSPGSVTSVASGELQTQSGFKNNVGLQNDLAELHQIMREHNEEDEAVEDDDEDDDGDVLPQFTGDDQDDDIEEDDDDIDSVHHNPTTTTSSIYQEEGIFHDSEDDYLYVVDRSDAYRRRASSVTSNISSTPYGSDGVKWHPPRKEMSRRRYIRDSLRCIKPLPIDEEWLGKIIIRAIPPPGYKTNNAPVSGFIFDQGIKGKPKASKVKSLRIENGIILNKCKNHFVKPYVVGTTGLLKTNARC
ncbi:LAFA_0E09032g1_1 [Lachancea sp. 'fantastica']|nr:LAFA_0E09032g1_1 [Lachancea sp. 'fantastica']